MVPSRGFTGWPIPAEDDEAFKEWLTSTVKEIVEDRQMSTIEVYDQISRKYRKSEHFKKLGVVYDYILACVDRALRQADAREVWTMDRG